MTTEPPPQQVGIQLTMADVNSQSGMAARSLKIAVDDLLSLNDWAQGMTTEALEALGFTTQAAAQLKSALGEVPAIADALDATQFLSKLWGTGVA